nr:MAG TPA: hypothetical protein [Caudoviricetes sp.]
MTCISHFLTRFRQYTVQIRCSICVPLLYIGRKSDFFSVFTKRVINIDNKSA